MKNLGAVITTRAHPSLTSGQLGLRQFEKVVSAICGVELLLSLGRLRMSGKAAPEIWNAVFAA